MNRDDYLAITEDRMIVRGPGVETGDEPMVQFGHDVPIPLPTHVRNLVVRRDGRACAFKGQDGRCYLVSRSGHVEPQGPAALDDAVAFTPDGRLFYIVDPGPRRPVATYMLGGVPYPMPRHTSQGVSSVADDGSIVWLDDQFATPASARTFVGIEFVKWRTLGPWTFGSSHAGVAVVNVATQRAFVLPEMNGTPWLLNGALVHGALVLVSSQPAVVRAEHEFTPYVPATTPVPAPPAAPGPIPRPPVEEPPVPMPESLLLDLQMERAKYPAHLARPEDAAAILNAVAWAHRGDGWGLSAKPSGNNVYSLRHQRFVAYDILHHKPTDTLWDVATGEWENMQVQWSHQPIHHNDPNRPWLAPLQPLSDVPTPTPDPLPEPPSAEPTPVACKCDEVLAEVQALRDEFSTYRLQMADMEIAIRNEIRALAEPVDVAQFPRYKGRVPTFGGSVTLIPEPNT